MPDVRSIASPAGHDTALRALANAVEGEVRFGRFDRMLYATDASIYQVEPLGVVVPASVLDAARAVEVCSAHALAMLPRGGGTSLAGQGVAAAVVIDLSARCDALLSLDTSARRCRVEPGITIERLNAHLRPAGLFFAPDPSTLRQANIGGCIGNNAAGARSVRYGRTSDHVMGIDACLADGRRVRLDEGAAARDATAAELTAGVADVVRRHEGLIRERFPRTMRRSAGYQLDVILQQLEAAGWDESRVNLAPLLCGSEGTLAVTLGAELRLSPLPRCEGLAVAAFSDLDEAIAAVPWLLSLGPSAVELLDDLIVDLAKGNPEQRRHVELLPAPRSGPLRAVLYVEFQEETEDAVDRGLASVVGGLPGVSVELYRDARSMHAAWALRRAGEPLLHAVPGHRKPLGFIEDNAVPPERLGEFVRSLRKVVQSEGTVASYYAHASVGVLHVRPLLDLRSPQDEAAMHRIASAAAELAKSLGGVMSGEHGDGRARGPLLEAYFGRELMGAFAEVKRIFDPRGLLNPGNIVAPGALASISGPTRVRAADDAPPMRSPAATYFDYEPQGGLLHAAELCNGAGVCRSLAGGAMCPAYRATRDERSSTRGWGNALRLAITGQLGGPAPDWSNEETKGALSLCLSCKACKAECPSSVDIAQLKAEFLAQHHDRGQGPPRQARFLAGFDDAAERASPARVIANMVSALPAARRLMQRRYGVDPRRSLPRLQRPLHRRWSPHDDLPDQAPTVVLVADTFTTHFEPEVGLAARGVLEAFGYRVELMRCGDLARAKISVGMLSAAILEIDDWMERFRPYLDHRPDVVGFIHCEPSCLSAVADEWLTLRTATPVHRRRRLAERSWLAEQFIERHWDDHPRHPDLAPPPGGIMLHAHCHQRALWGAGSSAAVLRRVFGEERVRVPDNTCCGMAGSFGYASATYDLSLRVAALSLIPSVEQTADSDHIAAPGTSCRHQIRDTTGRRALHPIELLARCLPGA